MIELAANAVYYCRDWQRLYGYLNNYSQVRLDMEESAAITTTLEQELVALQAHNARLVAENTLLKQLYVKAPFAYQSLDSNGCLLEVNDEWLATLGYTREEVVGRNFGEFLHPAWQDHFTENFPRFKAVGEILGVEFEMVGKDGAIVHVAFDGKIDKNPAGEFQQTYCVFQNLTRQKQVAEIDKILGLTEERLRLAQDSARLGLWERDMVDGTLNFSAELHDLYGLPPGTITSYGQWRQRVHPDDLARIEAERDAATAAQSSFTTEYRTRHASGEYLWVATKARVIYDAAGVPVRILGVNVDITERKQAEEALKESESQFHTMINAIPQLAWIADADGDIFWYNERWYAYTGTTPTQMKGWGWQSVHDPDQLPFILARWQESLASGQPFDMTFPLRGADGVFRPFLTRIIPIKDDAGQVRRWFGTNTDISELKQAMDQVEASLAEKEVMLREIHHRVKNNLQVISSMVSLQAENMTDARIRAELNDMRDRVRSMALVHEKLYQTGDLARLDFAEYVRSLLQYLWRSHSAMAQQVQLEQSLAAVPMSIETAVPCGLILNELVGNALKHAFIAGRGGKIRVALELTPSGLIRLVVGDNGVGLPQGFDWQQSPSLGLRLVQILARQLGGTVEKGSGPGTEFQILFPDKGMHL